MYKLNVLKITHCMDLVFQREEGLLLLNLLIRKLGMLMKDIFMIGK